MNTTQVRIAFAGLALAALAACTGPVGPTDPINTSVPTVPPPGTPRPGTGPQTIEWTSLKRSYSAEITPLAYVDGPAPASTPEGVPPHLAPPRDGMRLASVRIRIRNTGTTVAEVPTNQVSHNNDHLPLTLLDSRGENTLPDWPNPDLPTAPEVPGTGPRLLDRLRLAPGAAAVGFVTRQVKPGATVTTVRFTTASWAVSSIPRVSALAPEPGPDPARALRLGTTAILHGHWLAQTRGDITPLGLDTRVTPLRVIDPATPVPGPPPPIPTGYRLVSVEVRLEDFGFDTLPMWARAGLALFDEHGHGYRPFEPIATTAGPEVPSNHNQPKNTPLTGFITLPVAPGAKLTGLQYTLPHGDASAVERWLLT